MAKDLQIKITASDGASSVFTKIGSSASKAGQDIASSSQTAASGMGELGTAASTASTNMKSFSDAGTQIGTGLGLLATSLGIYSQSVIDNDRNMANLTRTYGDAAQGFADLADQLQDTTIFKNDEVIAAANSFGTLARNYGLTTDQIKELIRVSADLAAANGLSLTDAATRVQAAIRGEAESAEALGLTMNQTSIDTGNLTLSMTNAEAGQFRYNAILKQAAFAQGAAAEQAQTTSGKIKQLANDVQDAAQRFVDFTGPVGPAVAGLSSFGLEAGLAVTGLVQLGRGINTAASAMGGFSAILGTGGLVLAAGAAVYGVIQLSDALNSDFNKAMSDAGKTTSTLDAAIVSLTGSLGDAQTALAFNSIDSGLDQTIADLEHIRELRIDLASARMNTDLTGAGIYDDLEATTALQNELDALVAKYGDLDAAATDATGAQTDLANILTYTGAGAKDAQARALELSQAYNSGAISLAEYAWQLNWITENFANYDAAALSAAASTEALAAQAKSFTEISKDAYDAAVAVGVLDSSLEKMRAAGADTPAFNISSNIDGSALANTFDIIVKGSQSLADSADDVAKWAAGLSDAGEGVSKLKTLFDNGSISLETYNAAMQANTDIQAANAQIQNDILAIQANQLPLMAELTQQQADYIASLADLPAEQQLVALGYLNAAESARVLELAQLAASAASGALGDTGEATATKIITAAANADPVLKAMLADMGLISEGAEGEIVVNFPNATDLNTAVDNLSASIDALTLAIGNIPPVHTETNATETQGPVDNLTGAINDIPDSHNTNITATDNASGVIGGVSQALDNINGKTANTYLNNYVTTFTTAVTSVSPPTGTSGAPIGGMTGLTISAFATGGTLMDNVPRYVNGGTHAIVGEVGPELVWLPNGAQVTNAAATKSQMMQQRKQRGGGGSINIYGPLTLQPAGTDAYDALQQAMRDGARR
jgi:hypothetical protein